MLLCRRSSGAGCRTAPSLRPLAQTPVGPARGIRFSGSQVILPLSPSDSPGMAGMVPVAARGVYRRDGGGGEDCLFDLKRRAGASAPLASAPIRRDGLKPLPRLRLGPCACLSTFVILPRRGRWQAGGLTEGCPASERSATSRSWTPLRPCFARPPPLAGEDCLLGLKRRAAASAALASLAKARTG